MEDIQEATNDVKLEKWNNGCGDAYFQNFFFIQSNPSVWIPKHPNNNLNPFFHFAKEISRAGKSAKPHHENLFT